ncbi:DUF742 domain-containing protein [Plantactinospora sp. WMMB334]|uniref:DUF742 domain-containing protein n=1 Tax=Plantactinospora sp. WMMB334 TaxID=3404119 RepID=UPI003B94C8FC
MTEPSGVSEPDDTLVPLYVLVGGRTSPRNSNLDLATQVVALPVDTSRLEPEYQDIVDRCRTWKSIAEISAHLHRPLNITKLMVDVLVEQDALRIGTPAQHRITDYRLLETVLAGLKAL